MNKTIVVTGSRTITEADIIMFAGISGDTHPATTNREYAANTSINGKIIAHGLLVISVSEGLFVMTNYYDWERIPLVTLGFENVRFPNPVFPGDTIHSEISIVSTRNSRSQKDKKVIVFHVEVKNQKGNTVCEYDHPLLVEVEEK